jgi:hypothetical protein
LGGQAWQMMFAKIEALLASLHERRTPGICR